MILFKSVNEMPEVPVSQASMSWNRTGSWRSTTPEYKDSTPPCNFHCPAGEDIRGYLDLVKKGNTAEAFSLLIETNPFPAVCGRVCYHPCQAHCNRHSFDTDLKIRSLEQFLGDWGIENYNPPSLPESGRGRVAVIGAGPAGMTAAHYLRLKGIQVDLYDENEQPGGILRYGIPSYRLDNKVLAAEVERTLAGVTLKMRMKLGVDFGVEDLARYEAIFLATGAHKSRKMMIDGEDLPGVRSGLDFLEDVNTGGDSSLGDKTVLVIGGGNTACDVARSAYRLGAKVRVVYRRTESEMPAFSEEIEQLKAEPIELETLATPVRIELQPGGELKVILMRMELGQLDSSGRASPVPVDGSEYAAITDVVFTAIGEEADLSFVSGIEDGNDDGFDFSKVAPAVRDKLFVGGDILPNPRTVPHAVASGRLAAEKIIAFLSGGALPQRSEVAEVAGIEEINYNYFLRIKAARLNEYAGSSISIATESEARAEADRCFSCGVCNECDNCYNFCPDLAVIKTESGYQVNLDYCKGCGICSTECPGGSLRWGEGRVR